MNAYCVHYFGLMLARYAEVEAMKAQNLCRADTGLPPAYDEESFNRIADDLRLLAEQVINSPHELGAT